MQGKLLILLIIEYGMCINIEIATNSPWNGPKNANESVCCHTISRAYIIDVGLTHMLLHHSRYVFENPKENVGIPCRDKHHDMLRHNYCTL